MKYPKITIITPSYNQGQFISKTIESLLAQGIDEIEYLVMDGGSNDKTIEVLKAYGDRIKWVSEPDEGQAHAVNKGLAQAQGEIIGWLNSDDIFYPGALKKILEVFEAYPEVDVIYGMADHIDADDCIIEPYPTESWDYERLKETCFICQPALFFRKQVVEKFGPLDKKLKYCMDYEYWLRIGLEIDFYFLKEKLAGSRLYDENKTLGSRVPVHLEIMDMFKDNFGKVPHKWLLAHSHYVAEEEFNKTPVEGLTHRSYHLIVQNYKNFWKYNKELFLPKQIEHAIQEKQQVIQQKQQTINNLESNHIRQITMQLRKIGKIFKYLRG